VASQTAEEVIPILRQLLQQLGAPLVLKSDNGSAFIAELLGEAITLAQVVQLFSPAYRPQFNGTLERSNTTNKTYTGQEAMINRQPRSCGTLGSRSATSSGCSSSWRWPSNA
jgi:transposase InsO family protein